MLRGCLRSERQIAMTPVCPVCDTSGATQTLTCPYGIVYRKPLTRYQCDYCGCIFGPLHILAMSQAELRAMYQKVYSWFDESDNTVGEMTTFGALSPRQDGRYLNWGAGRWSQGIAQLRARGYDVIGYEPFIDCMPHVVSEIPVDSRFDGIFSHDLIEHLTHPIDEFQRMISMLRPHGRMAHMTPCYKYHIPQSEGHVVFWTGRSVDVLCERVGLRIVSRGELCCVFARKDE